MHPDFCLLELHMWLNRNIKDKPREDPHTASLCTCGCLPWTISAIMNNEGQLLWICPEVHSQSCYLALFPLIFIWDELMRRFSVRRRFYYLYGSPPPEGQSRCLCFYILQLPSIFDIKYSWKLMKGEDRSFNNTYPTMQFINGGKTKSAAGWAAISSLPLWHNCNNFITFPFARNNIKEIHLALAWVATATCLMETHTHKLGTRLCIH